MRRVVVTGSGITCPITVHSSSGVSCVLCVSLRSSTISLESALCSKENTHTVLTFSLVLAWKSNFFVLRRTSRVRLQVFTRVPRAPDKNAH